MSLWKKTEKPESSAEKPEGKETEKPGLPVDKAAVTGKNRPQITGISPRAAIPGGEIVIRGSGLAEDGRRAASAIWRSARQLALEFIEPLDCSRP